MKIALIVGINHYDNGGALFGCVNDARLVKAVLERHGDGSVNFDCNSLQVLDLVIVWFAATSRIELQSCLRRRRT